jgi:hypothetical protein
VVLVPIVAMTVVMGVFPNMFLRPMEASVNRMLDQVSRGAPVRIQAIHNSQPSIDKSSVDRRAQSSRPQPE